VEAEKIRVMLKEISSELDDLENRRETLIKGSREVIINCSRSIVSLHRGRQEEADKLLKNAQAELSSLRIHARDGLDRYLLSAEQELVEAFQIKCVYENSSLAGIEELQVATSSYLLGLLDSIGEMKRIIYDNLRAEHNEDALDLFGLMEDLYNSIYPFSVYDNIVPGIKRKLDVAKILIETVRTSLTEESSRNLLTKKIDLLEKRIVETSPDAPLTDGN
jgi:translin